MKRLILWMFFYLFFAGLRLRGPGSKRGGGGLGIVHLIWPCGGKGWCWVRLCVSGFWCSDAGDGWRMDGWIGLGLAGLLDFRVCRN